ncbi:MAG TPA: LPS export ABC transporter periplasmic protein LptC [Gallionella sp.]
MIFASRVRHWLPVLPLLGILAGTYWLNQQSLPEPGRQGSKESGDPDAIMENFSAMQLSKEGLPRFTIAADRLQHYPVDDRTTLDAPRVTIVSPGQPVINSTAKRGAISGKGDEVFLYDDVMVLRGAYTDRPELRVDTEYLHIVPGKDLIDTDKAIRIVEGSKTLHATGLQIDNNARTFKLLSNVRSTYVPAKN